MTFAEFWRFYLQEHSKPLNRRLHVIGTSLAGLTLLSAAVLRNPYLGWLALLFGYGFAWFGHFFVQKNRPATFRYPLWSLLCDFRLWFLTITGRSP